MADITAWLLEYVYRIDDRVTVWVKIKKEHLKDRHQIDVPLTFILLSLVNYCTINTLIQSNTNVVEVLFGREVNIVAENAYLLIIFFGTIRSCAGFLKFLHIRLDPIQAQTTNKDHGDGYIAWGAFVGTFVLLAILLLLIDGRSGNTMDALVALHLLPATYLYLAMRKGPNKPRRKKEVKIKAVESILERIDNIEPQSI